MVKKIIVLILSILISVNVFANLRIMNNNVTKKSLDIETIYFGKTPYFSASKLSKLYNIRVYNNKTTGKFVFYFESQHIKITANSSFVMVGTNIKHMTSPAVQASNEIYVPVFSFLSILKKYVYADLKFHC